MYACACVSVCVWGGSAHDPVGSTRPFVYACACVCVCGGVELVTLSAVHDLLCVHVCVCVWGGGGGITRDRQLTMSPTWGRYGDSLCVVCLIQSGGR